MPKRKHYILLLAFVLLSAIKAAAQIAMPDTVCIGDTRHYWVDSTSTTGSTFTWKINGIIKQNGPINLFSNTWGTTGTYPLSVQELSAEGCLGPLRTGQVFVVPFPSAVLSGGTIICEGDTAMLRVVFTGSPPWDLTYTNGFFNTTVSNITSNPYDFSVSPPAGSYIYSLVAVSGANCPATPADLSGTANVIVHNSPVTDFSSTTACEGDTTFFSISGNYLNMIGTWLWDFGDGTYGTFNSPFNATHIYANAGNYIVTLTVSDSIGCSYTTNHPVVVRPLPVSYFSNSSPECYGSPVLFTDLSSNPSGMGYIKTWEWNFGDGSAVQTFVFPDSPNVLHTYSAAGIYGVTLTISSSLGCKAVYTSNVTVINHPLAGFTFTSNCVSQPTQFNDVSLANGFYQVNSWYWEFNDPNGGINNTSNLQNPQHTYSTAGTYPVKLIISNTGGCYDTVYHSVTVKPAPIAAFTSSPGCVNAQTHFWADTTAIDINTIATYNWNFGDGNTGNGRNIQHNYQSPGMFIVTLTLQDTAGCFGSISHQVLITIPPVAHFSANLSTCAGQAVQFTDLSTSVDGYNLLWEWNFGDGTTQTFTFPAVPNAYHIYPNPGMYEVKLTVTNNLGCSAFETKTIRIYSKPQSNFLYAGQCQDSPIVFTDITPISTTINITAWQWNFGDPASGSDNSSALQNPFHVYTTAGPYAVQLITWSDFGCSDTVTKNILVKAKPAVEFTNQGSCEDTPMLFIPDPAMDQSTIATWNWLFGDGNNSTSSSPSHTYTSAGTYAVQLTVSDTAGCTNTISHTVVIVPAPAANFSFTAPLCNQSSVTFDDITTVPSGFITSWTWNFGDGSSQTIAFPNPGTISHTFVNAGTFNVILTVKTSDSCSNTISKLVTVSPKPLAAFSYSGVCLNTAVLFSDISTSPGGAITERFWDFGEPASGTANNSTLISPTHIYAVAGPYTVTLIVTTANGCSDTTIQTLTITPPPLADFTSVAGCKGDTTQFNSSASINMPTTASWLWQFGDGQTSALPDPLHVYLYSGTFVVTLTIIDTSGCPASKSATIVIVPGPVAGFAASSPTCVGSAVTFTDLTSFPSGTIVYWHWTFGDGTDTTYTATSSTISHIYSQAGNFNVKLTVNSQNGCENTYQQVIAVSPGPVARFTWQNTCKGIPTQFIDQSEALAGIAILSRSWNFGDPTSGTANTSSLLNPVHTFSNTGPFLVSLITINAMGCSDTIRQQLIITPEPGVDFYHDTVTCSSIPLTFYTDTTATNIPAVQSYNWSFGDGSASSSLQNPVHNFSNPGIYNVILTITDSSGCMNSVSYPVTIGDSPVTSFSYANSCAGAATQFTDLSFAPNNGKIVSCYWDFGVNGSLTDTSTFRNPSFDFSLPGIYSVSLTTISESGCTSTLSKPVQVFNKPSAAFKYTASPCSQGSVQFADSSYSYQSVIKTWQWTFEPFQYSILQNPVYQYFETDTCYNVKLIVSDERGCIDTSTRLVCVPAPLELTFTHQQECFGKPMKFVPQITTPITDSLVSFNWNFGNPQSGSANISTLKKPSHTFTKTGYFSVNLTAIDKFGCSATSIQTVLVEALPVVSFTYIAGLCDSTVALTSTSADTSAAITTYIWNYGDGTSDTIHAPNNTTTHTYHGSESYNIKLTVLNDNGCMAEKTTLYDPSPCLEAAFTNTSQTGCQDKLIAFHDLSTCQGTISQWNWNWGDGSPATVYSAFSSATTHSFAQAGVYTVKLRVTTLVNGKIFSDSASTNVNILASPLAGFSTQGACAGSRANFYDTTNYNGVTATNFRWDFGDPAAGNDTSGLQNPYYKYPVLGDYEARLIVTNALGCSDTAINTVRINGLPVADFNFSVACLGHPTHFFDLSETSQAPFSHLGWLISSGSKTIGKMIGQNVAFTFDSLGVYSILHAVSDTNKCTDTVVYKITVVPAPFSAFSINEDYEKIQGQVKFENGSIAANKYYWDFGNGQTSNLGSPVITYNEDGDYLVQLYARNNYDCVDSTSVIYKMMYKGLWVPNAMAVVPNTSTLLWKPVGVNLASYNAEVFDRWGKLLWQSDKLTEKGAPAEGWNGTFNESPCKIGVYIWKITATFRNGTMWYNNDVGNRDGLTGGNTGIINLIR